MNTVSIVGSVSRRAGGLFESVRRLHQELLSQNPVCAGLEKSESRKKAMGVSVLGLDDESTELDLDAWKPVPVHRLSVCGPRSLGYAPGLPGKLAALNPDLVHVHGLWQLTSLGILSWHRKTGRPYLVSIHGMLDDWALRNSKLKKLMAWFGYERRHLSSASCIRALCPSEAHSIRSLGLTNPICVIPNGVDLPRHGNSGDREPDEPSSGSLLPASLANRNVLLYLGRFHPKKGLGNLLKAWAKSKTKSEWLLVLAGWDQNGHEKELKSLACELRLVWANRPLNLHPGISLFFAGPQFGPAKTRWLKRCDAFILPSFSEGLPMAVLEAWAYAKPVLMTPQCHLPEGFAVGAAMRFEPHPDSIAAGLEELFCASCSSLQNIGARGLELVTTRFTWPQIAGELRDVYLWMAGGEPMPKCMSD